jgi:hypothetical protein
MSTPANNLPISSEANLSRALRERGWECADEGASTNHGQRDETNDRPWYISLLLGISGWIAGVFLLGFVAILFFTTGSRETIATIAGVVLLAAAWGLFRVDVEGAFVSQFALSLSIAGQFALVYGLTANLAGRTGEAAWIAFALQALLVIIMPSRMHRVMSAFFACAALALAVRAMFGDDPFRNFRGDQMLLMPSLPLTMAAWALTWVPIGIVLYLCVTREHVWMASRWRAALRPALVGLTLGLAWATLLTSYRPLGMGTELADWLSLWPLLSAFAALACVAVAFALRHRALMGATILAALLHISHFYYAMGVSLLMKSLIMLLMGGAMLLLARALTRTGSAS